MCSVYAKPAAESENENDDDLQNDEMPNYDYDDEDTPEENNESIKDSIRPTFESTSKVFTEKIGQTVVLPCSVKNLGSYVTAWKHNAQLLYQAQMKVTEKNNIKRRPGDGALEILLQSESDGGNYTCELLIDDDDTPEITHVVNLLQSPKIVSIGTTNNNNTVFNVGDTLEIMCKVEGNPPPQIKWYKGHTKSELINLSGETLRIENLQIRDGGSYRCFADNKIEKAAHAAIDIRINHKPLVNVEKFVVTSDTSLDAELKCSVSAYPPALGGWQKDGKNVVPRPPHLILNKSHNHYILLIKELREEDFGKYTCMAKNMFGMTEKHIYLVNTPAIRDFVKPPKGLKDTVLTWKVESKSPISEHELQYRKVGDSEWKNVKPEVTNGNQDIYTIDYTLKGLEPGTYEARVRSQNSHGWSEYSDIMKFEGVAVTKHNKHHNKKHHNKENEHKETQKISTQEHDYDATPAQHQENDISKESQLGASQTGGSASLISTASTILCIAFLNILLVNRQ